MDQPRFNLVIGYNGLGFQGNTYHALLISTTDHVYYVDTNQHIDQLYFNGSSWVNQDLTALAPSSPAVALGTGLSSLYIGADHIYFIDQSNQHINQIYFNGSGWVYQDLTVAAGTSTTAQHGSALTSLYIGADHVYYTDTAGHVNQIYFNGSGWTNQDLTSLAGTSAVASARSPLISLYISTDHVYYVDSNQKVNQLYFNGSGWTNQNISTASGTSAVANLRSGITSLYFSSADHIYYVDGSQHLDELSWTGTAWLNQDLTSASGTSAIAQIDEGLGSLETSSGDHVFYVDTAAHVALMEYSGPSRYNLDLTALTGGPSAMTPTVNIGAPSWSPISQTQYFKYDASGAVEDSTYSGSLPYSYYFSNLAPGSAPQRTVCPYVSQTTSPSHMVYWFVPYAYPYPPVTEFHESDAGTNVRGMEFYGSLAGSYSSAPGTTMARKSVYFTDRPCTDAGREVGFSRHLEMGPIDPATGFPEGLTLFYFSDFTNCDGGFAGQILPEPPTASQGRTLRL